MLSKDILKQLLAITNLMNDKYILGERSERISNNYLHRLRLRPQVILHTEELKSLSKNYNSLLSKLENDFRVTTLLDIPEENNNSTYTATIEPTFIEFALKLHKFVENRKPIDESALILPRLDLMAELAIAKMGQPVVFIRGQYYEFPVVPVQSLPFSIVEHCLTKHPNESIHLEQLRNELQARSLPYAQLRNIAETLRKSPIFGTAGPLNIFIKPTPNTITVKDKVEFPNEFYLNTFINATLLGKENEIVHKFASQLISGQDFKNHIKKMQS